MFTESTILDVIQILPSGHVQVRRLTTYYKDGEKIGEQASREVLIPGQDVSTQSTQIQSICEITWTPEIIAAAQANIAAQLQAE